MDGEHIVRDPHHVRFVRVEQPFHFIYYRDRLAAPVSLPKYLMTTPTTVIWAAPRGDKGERSLPMRFAPSVYVPLNIYRVTSRPRLRVNVRNLLARAGLIDMSRLVQKSYPRNSPQF
jgi:hypothetical protein